MKFIYFLLFLLFSSCTNISENQKNILDKKWFSGSDYYVIFKSDMTTQIMYKGDLSSSSFELKNDNTLILKTARNDSTIFTSYKFKIKDSILELIYLSDEKNIDTSFLHLNPKYNFWQIRELYYYGKIIHEQDPSAFIYFEF